MKIQRIISVFILLTFILLLPGCGRQEAVSIPGLPELQKQDGVFSWKGLDWGLTIQQLEEQLGDTLSEELYNYDKTVDYRNEPYEGLALFEALQPTALAGVEMRIQYFFQSGKLDSVTLAAFSDDTPGEALAATFAQLKADLINAYGEPQKQVEQQPEGSAIESLKGFDSTYLVWHGTEKDGRTSGLQLDLTESEAGAESLLLTVFYF